MERRRVQLLEELQATAARSAETRRLLHALEPDATPGYREHRLRVRRIAKAKAYRAQKAWEEYLREERFVAC